MQNKNYLLVTTKDGGVIGKLRERDGITDCKLTEKQNDNSTLTFNMLTSSEKYPLLANPENLIIAGDRVFSAIYDGDSLTEKKDSGNKNTAAFSFVERQCLLDKVRITAYNSTTTYDHIDEGMVVILSGGIAPLTVNGAQLSCPYLKGTAAYALYAVLHGTDWSVGTVDVDGTFDLETDKKSVLENVKAIQSLWGGILIFDSLERKIHLRSEEIYRPYNGYGVRFKFNETGLERSVNRNIITRLYVYGKDNLNIAASNGGKEYLENYSCTSTPLCGVMVNNDITNAGDLIVWGKRELEKVCKPQVTLKLSLIDRSQLEGGASFDVSDIIDVVDEDLSAEKYQARVTEKSYSFFQPWECTVTLGDEKEVFAAKIKYVMENADKVNDLLDLFNRISSDDINMSGTKQSMTSYVQLTNEALEAGFKVIGVDGYERTGKTKISIDGIDVYNGGIVVRDRQNNVKIYMDGQTGNIIFSGDLYGASGTFSGALEAATGTFSGELKAATGSFEGDITAKSGCIGSWQILDGGNTVSGALVSRTGNEKTVINGGRINMYCWNDELNDEYGGWEKEGAIYTNKNFGGGICLSSVDNRPIVFGVGGVVAAKIIPAEMDSEGKITEDTHFVFRNGTKIYREKITTKNVEFTGSPLLTEAQDVVGAINELFQDGEGGGDDWSPPDWWIPVPEPKENEVLILVDIIDNPQSYSASNWGYMHDGTNNYHGTFTIDYGNGVSGTVKDGNSAPIDINTPYTAKGQYIITMVSDDRLFYRPVDQNRNTVLMIKCGANISCRNSGMSASYNLYGLNRTQYIQLGGEPLIENGFLYNAKCIKKVKYLNSPAEIPDYAFNNLATLSYLEGVNGVTSIGQYAFSGCSSLRKIRTLPEDCTFGRDAFMGCYSMPYPRPDGSIN